MKPIGLKSKIFLDSSDPRETQAIKNSLGFLDGQTTNPTSVSLHPEVKKRIAKGLRFTTDELLGFYKEVIQQIAAIIPDGSISIEVYADQQTKAEAMFEQAKEFATWIPNARIKLPSVPEGIKAAMLAVNDQLKINMTLCFSQAQAAAVHVATKGAQPDQVVISPFVGRLDDRGQNGMDLLANIIRMYRQNNSHVGVLAASIRDLRQFLAALKLESDIITTRFAVLEEWVNNDKRLPGADFFYEKPGFELISYQSLNLDQNWYDFDLNHPLTDRGLEQFAADWNSLIKK
ncbi:MAG: transaldolase [Candidatus Buchananbacteria bacterium]|nr:transaldolase [Candidatus Buchananbacteria bacterium]